MQSRLRSDAPSPMTRNYGFRHAPYEAAASGLLRVARDAFPYGNFRSLGTGRWAVQNTWHIQLVFNVASIAVLTDHDIIID
jgi:hypothetical protein